MEKIDKRNFSAMISKKLSIVDFCSVSCGPCAAVETILDDICVKHNGHLNVYKCDVEENPGIASKYRIMSLPTVMLFRHGKPSRQIAGMSSAKKIEELVNDAIGGR